MWLSQYNVLKSPSVDNAAKVVIARPTVIVKPMDLTMIMKNIAAYQNFEQFLADVEWMVHNCMVLYSSECHFNRKNNETQSSSIEINKMNYFKLHHSRNAPQNPNGTCPIGFLYQRN